MTNFSKKKNHFNVKLLRGYGISITKKDNKIILKNGQYTITGKSEKDEWFASKIPYEKIIINEELKLWQIMQPAPYDSRDEKVLTEFAKQIKEFRILVEKFMDAKN